ncbi:MAG: TolC family protein [Flavobacterium sp.]
MVVFIMIKNSLLILMAVSSAPALSIGYGDYIEFLYNESPLVATKLHEVEAEREASSAVNKFYMPKINASSTYKEKENISAVVESKVTANSVLFDDVISNKIRESELRLLNAELGVKKIKEQIKFDVTDALVNIKYYMDLNIKSKELRGDAILLLSNIKNKVNAGVASETDLQLAELLVQKIDGEINVIDKNLALLRSKVEVVSGVPYPKENVELGELVEQKILGYSERSSYENVVKNYDYIGLNLQSEIAKENANQQNSLYNVSLVAELRYDDNKKSDTDSYVGAQVTVNLFDYDKIKAKSSRDAIFSSLKMSAEMKRRELVYSYQANDLELRAVEGEIKDLLKQRDLVKMIIDNQLPNYDIGRSSFYEMLRTRFDYFIIERDLADLFISKVSIELAKMRLTGYMTEL